LLHIIIGCSVLLHATCNAYLLYRLTAHGILCSDYTCPQAVEAASLHYQILRLAPCNLQCSSVVGLHSMGMSVSWQCLCINGLSPQAVEAASLHHQILRLAPCNLQCSSVVGLSSIGHWAVRIMAVHLHQWGESSSCQVCFAPLSYTPSCSMQPAMLICCRNE
jgi:hypothetical protein